MDEVWQGVLKREYNKQGRATKTVVVGPTKKRDKSQTYQLRLGALSQDLEQSREKEVEVDYEFDAKGQVHRVRARGAAWVEPAAGSRAPNDPPKKPHGGPKPGGGGTLLAAAGPRPPGAFHNPYNFIPAPPPDRLDGDRNDPTRRNHHPLGRFAPVGHDRWRPGYFSGSIDIEITTKTPLLIPDTSRVEIDEERHQTFPLLVDGDGRPRLRPTSLKGVLRAAFEAVTNSRFGVFSDHDERLARRMDAGEGLAMIPARISDSGTQLELFLGVDVGKGRAAYPKFTGNRFSPGNIMYAGWFRAYFRNGRPNPTGPNYDRDYGLNYKGGHGRARHNDPVACLLELVEKLNPKNGNVIFSYWSVVEAIKGHNVAALTPIASAPSLQRPSFGQNHRRTGRFMHGLGYVCVTGQNIGNKHDERVFFVPPGRTPDLETLNADWITQWKRLVEDYREKAKRALAARKDRRPPADPWGYLGRDPGQTAFSRHVFEPGAEKLDPGDLCYARVDRDGKIVGLYPVMIARELGDAPPQQFLAPGLKPAQSRDEMSPADRVFGWVRQSRGGVSDGMQGTWRGQLRIANVRCETPPDDAVTEFASPGLPLAILSTPKPEQARFYLAADPTGEPLPDGQPRIDATYKNPISKNADAGRGLRGRKVYPHHVVSEDYWQNPHEVARRAAASPREPQVRGGRPLEYVRVAEPNDLRNDQNRSILGWVNPGTAFTARIDVTNLSEAELGALLWLLHLDDGHFHRLGGGKPLGFGSVRIRIKSLDLADGEALAADCATLMPDQVDMAAGVRIPTAAQRDNEQQASVDEMIKTPVEAFTKAIEDAYGPFDKVPFIAAFLNATKGFDKPVHYPRAQRAPDPAGENYKWFVGNSNTRARPTTHFSLDPLWASEGLPFLDEKGNVTPG